MMAAARTATPVLRGSLRCGESLGRHTVWGIGGPADRLYRPADADDLAAFLATLPPGEPLFWLGLGSNLLVRDGGIEGTVILIAGVLDGIERGEGTRVRAGAGAPCPKLARFCARHGLGGGEFFAGIPGTLGGALAMNAGAWGGDTWTVVRAVETVDRAGRRRTRTPAEYTVGYRTVVAPAEEWFIGAEIELRPEPAAAVEARMRELVQRRAETQPMGQRSCGSVFRNPPGDFAARLVEACGLKGLRIGDAVVSEKHANFIVNVGAARARDVEALIERVRDTVEREHGVRLEPEVRIVGRREAAEAGA